MCAIVSLEMYHGVVSFCGAKSRNHIFAGFWWAKSGIICFMLPIISCPRHAPSKSCKCLSLRGKVIISLGGTFWSDFTVLSCSLWDQHPIPVVNVNEQPLVPRCAQYIVCMVVLWRRGARRWRLSPRRLEFHVTRKSVATQL